MNAIPTLYAGVQFRSRLEARWAAFFDLLKVEWHYEPFDLRGYIPDFILPDHYGEDNLVEVKPSMSSDGLIDAAIKINDSGWDNTASVVGARLEAGLSRFPIETWEKAGYPDLSLPSDHFDGILLGWFNDEPWCGISTQSIWREAGNIVQWKPPR